MIKLYITLINLLLALFLNAQENETFLHLKTSWDHPYTKASEIVDTYTRNQSQIKKRDQEARTYNLCFFLLESGKYILQNKGENPDVSTLVKQIHLPSLDHPAVNTFINQLQPDPAIFTDYYYMIKALKKGEKFNNARDGFSMSTQFTPRPLNNWDYVKLRDIFSRHNTTLQNIYLEKMKFLFRNNGCTDEMMTLRLIIQKNIPASSLKNEILQLYDRYEKIRKGHPAPTPTLKDETGKEYSFKDFSGKVIVVDVWATWCCSCIEKMPAFIQLRDEFRNNNQVIFLTVSIDRQYTYEQWKKALTTNKMQGMINLISGEDDPSSFETAYCIPSVPRYLVIDQQGKIVDAYAPSPGNELKQLIQNTLKQ